VALVAELGEPQPFPSAAPQPLFQPHIQFFQRGLEKKVVGVEVPVRTLAAVVALVVLAVQLQLHESLQASGN